MSDSRPIEEAQTSGREEFALPAPALTLERPGGAQITYYTRDQVCALLASAPPAAATVEVPPQMLGWDVWAAFTRAQDLIAAIAQGGCDAPQIAAHSAAAELREVRAALSTPTAQKAEGGEVPDVLKLAQQCGATVYRNRATPMAPAVAFGDESWRAFAIKLGNVFRARPTPAAAAGVPPGLLELLREIRPMADYGRVGTRDIDQGRYQRALDAAIAMLAASGAPTEGGQ